MDEVSKYYLATRPDLLAFLPNTHRNLKILEVGCGAGNFRSNFSDGCEYWGIEPSQKAAKIAQQKLDKVLVGTFQEVFEELPIDYFDYVICADVIEHMENEVWFLQSIKKNMRNEALIVGSIPNVRYIWNLYSLLILKDWKYADIGVLDRTHLRFFTKKSLIRTFKTNGYLIEKLNGINEISIGGGTLKSLIINVLVNIFSWLLGRDSRYLQFGFRIKVGGFHEL